MPCVTMDSGAAGERVGGGRGEKGQESKGHAMHDEGLRSCGGRGREEG